MFSDPIPQARWFLAALGLGIGIFLGSSLKAWSASPTANFFETIGISTAVGTVLGASTLPFYEDPGSQLLNLAIGAAIGGTLGLGIWVYDVSTKKEDKMRRYWQRQSGGCGESCLKAGGTRVVAARPILPSSSVSVIVPVVSLRW